MNQFIIPIGDWSEDGHKYSENFTVNVNKTRREIIDAYHATTKRLNISFDTNEMRESSPIRILEEWEDNQLSLEAVTALKNGGVNLEPLLNCDIDNDGAYSSVSPKDTAILFMEFIKSTMPDMEYEFVTNNNQYLFGYWGDLNISVGYGCFLD